ncbi:MAG: cyclophilin family peptidyl-prolyl cis-trans isomerase [Rhodothermales bacterium]|jgi:cyclophilin family peptidyl-prolyl cis-trans isomerase
MNLYRVLPALAALTLVLVGCSGPQPSFTLADMPGDGLYAELVTDKGSFLIQLEFEKAPLTVINFVSLAQGTRKTNRPGGIPFYDGLTFHRVDAEFVIQGGCPNGNGSGNAGYQFPDEFHPDLRHDAVGVVSMANAHWPDSNGSQFMILRSPAKHLDDLHSVFGKVAKGLEVASSIAANDRIYKVAIFRVGAAAEAFKTDQNAFIAAQTVIIETRKKVEAQKQAALTEKLLKEWPEAKVTESGLIIKVDQLGAGEPPKDGDVVAVHAILKMSGEREFDNSYDRKLPHVFELGKGKVIAGWDEGVHGMLPGEKRSLVVPPDLAYGAEGRKGLVLPYETIYLTVELVEINPPPEKYAPPKKRAQAPSEGPPPPPGDPAPVETPAPPADTPTPAAKAPDPVPPTPPATTQP